MTGSINLSFSLAAYADVHSEHLIRAQESIPLVVGNCERRIARTVGSNIDQSGILYVWHVIEVVIGIYRYRLFLPIHCCESTRLIRRWSSCAGNAFVSSDAAQCAVCPPGCCTHCSLSRGEQGISGQRDLIIGYYSHSLATQQKSLFAVAERLLLVERLGDGAPDVVASWGSGCGTEWGVALTLIGMVCGNISLDSRRRASRNVERGVGGTTNSVFSTVVIVLFPF